MRRCSSGATGTGGNNEGEAQEAKTKGEPPKQISILSLIGLGGSGGRKSVGRPILPGLGSGWAKRPARSVKSRPVEIVQSRRLRSGGAPPRCATTAPTGRSCR